MTNEHYLFAVEPEELVVIAKWPIAHNASTHETEKLQEACQAIVGPDIVILRSKDHPDWDGAIAAVGLGKDPFTNRKATMRRMLETLKDYLVS